MAIVLVHHAARHDGTPSFHCHGSRKRQPKWCKRPVADVEKRYKHTETTGLGNDIMKIRYSSHDCKNTPNFNILCNVHVYVYTLNEILAI